MRAFGNVRVRLLHRNNRCWLSEAYLSKVLVLNQSTVSSIFVRFPFVAKRVLSLSLMCAAATLLLVPAPARAQLAISVSFGPPAIPYYTQPPCPTPNYVWSPGYWAYEDGGGYYWVPGTWVAAPAVGLNWTPGYWGWNDGSYGWNQGYWAPQVGYYGGINYGYGYSGRGYERQSERHP
jgi:hypothetical protein